VSEQAELFPNFPTPQEGELNALRFRVQTLEANILYLLKNVADSMRPCVDCNAELFFVRTSLGEIEPFTRDGLSHFRNCPHPERFSRSSR
jgi:uncharacterized protein with PIN domain